MEGSKILIIDDDPEYLEELGGMLRESGYAVDILNDSTRALDKVKAFQPDLVLLDLKMPVKSGFEVAAELRADAGTRETRVIAVTGHYTEREKRQLMQQYALERILLKPLKPLDVIAQVEEVLRERRSS